MRLGKHEFAAVTASPVSALKWMDTRDVSGVTTAHDPKDVVFVKRTQRDGTKVDVLCPKATADYTQATGGVDRFHHFRSSYPINRKSRKFWMIMFFLFDVAIINSYITYTTIHRITSDSHKE